MRKKWKKAIALLLCLMMAGTLAACGGNNNDKPSGGNTNKPGDGDEPGTEADIPDYVTAPVTIEFWHTLSSDAATALDEMVAEFNASNEYGITVNATYQGGYYDVLSKTISSYGTNTAPTMVVIGAGGIEQLADAGALADMAAYIERDNWDYENIPETLRFYMQHYDGQFIEFPYLVSTAVIYYNKALFDKEPESLEEWVSMAEEITKSNSGVYGMAMALDTGFIQRPILKSLGAPGLTNATGDGPATLDDGSLKTYLTDWKSWIDDGFCMPVTVTDFGSKMQNQFVQGKLASFVLSTANMNNIEQLSKESGIDLGVAKMVGYGGYDAAIGGGGISILEDSTQQEKAAAWEFLKFLLTDENQITMHQASSYLPFTTTARASEELAALWEDHPGFAAAAEQLEWATYNDWSIYLSEWRTQIGNCFSAVLVDGSMTPDEAVEYLRTQANVIFP